MEYSGFFNGDQEYGQDEFSRYFDNIYESGVSINEDNNMTLQVNKCDSGVQVDKGFSIIKGFYLYNDSIKNIGILKDSNYDRIDRVIIRLNLNSKKVSIDVKKGIPSSNPEVPSLQRDNLVYELSLAQIKVPKNGEMVIVDERYKKELCGAIRPKNLTEFNSMIEGFTNQFNKWFEAQQAKGWRNVFIQNTTPEKVVPGSIWIQI
ncbi:hypothetical protein SAMN02745163_01568 [Clostridium cavendishii DSM 21758]|uniref:Uncharacterized protein n=1 Tax=Clostridium cavendishii DSM 21758 TaxID=1121302 RepID=A0A1M6HST1_9CLOT|nr:hypothetical protein [Clostridium cavendishii]SHJ25276.1 hypothetical protein SAMN02745163_01568 [Clostridium cavendishii DSM 21758]